MRTRIVRILLLFGILGILTACDTRATVAEWKANYCEEQGCPSDKKVVEKMGIIVEGQPLECPSTQSVLYGVLSTGKGGAGLYHTYYLDPSSCQMVKVK